MVINNRHRIVRWLGHRLELQACNVSCNVMGVWILLILEIKANIDKHVFQDKEWMVLQHSITAKMVGYTVVLTGNSMPVLLKCPSSCDKLLGNGRSGE